MAKTSQVRISFHARSRLFEGRALFVNVARVTFKETCLVLAWTTDKGDALAYRSWPLDQIAAVEVIANDIDPVKFEELTMFLRPVTV